MSDKLIIEAIKTDIGYFIRAKKNRFSHYDENSGLDSYFLDNIPGKELERTNNPTWVKVKKLPKIVEEEKHRPDINHRYELKDKSLVSDKIPLTLSKEEVIGSDKGSYNFDWIESYAHLKSLYELKFDKQTPLRVNVDFEIQVILQIDKIKEYGGFKYPIQRTNWAYDGFFDLTEKSVQNDQIDTIIFPDIVLPARKSYLTSEQSFKIIRKHVEDNINPKYAEITSNYNFCFDVAKKIPLVKPVPYQKDVSRWGAKKPKFVTDYRDTRKIRIFEMTHTGEGGNYKGYTPVEGFKGANIEELKQNIDDYLAALMNRINEPLIECECCGGRGVVLNQES